MILYKYCPPARVDVLEKLKIRFTPPGSFNDPFEFRPVLKSVGSDADVQSYIDREFDKVVDAELQKIGPILHLVPPEHLEKLRSDARTKMLPALRAAEATLIPKLRQIFEAKFNEHFGVLCLSEQWDSLLMWAHYSQSHEGFLIGFDAAHPFFKQRRSENDEFGFLRRVRYQENRPIVSLMASGGLEWFETKADAWNYENEWRMFLPLSNAAEVLTVSGNPIHLFSFPPDCVREILLGARCSEQTEGALRVALKMCAQEPTFMKCVIDDSEYRIVRRVL